MNIFFVINFSDNIIFEFDSLGNGNNSSIEEVVYKLKAKDNGKMKSTHTT